MGMYETYLEGVKALYSGPNPRFKNQSDLARFVGLEPAQIKKYSERETTKNLEKIFSFLDKVGAQIVFPGENLDEFVLIPRVKAIAGCGESFQVDGDVSGSYAFRRSFFQYLGVNPKHCKAMFVQGDSMQPLINDRDMILFDEQERDIREGYIYVLNYDEALMVKRFQRITDGWNICSENPTYSPVPVQGQNMEKLKVYGRVRWFGRVV